VSKVDIHKTNQDDSEASKNMLHAAVIFCIDIRCEEKKYAHPDSVFRLHHESIHANKH